MKLGHTLLVAGALLIGASSTFAVAQTEAFPSKPVTLVVPFRRDEPPPEFERTNPDNDQGFVGRLHFRGVNDTIVLNVVDRFGDEEIETDGAFALVRQDGDSTHVVVDGSYLNLGGRRVLRTPERGFHVGRTGGEEGR